MIETLEQGGIDLILLDVMLPGEDGFTLLDKIRRYQVPVIFVSARSQLCLLYTSTRSRMLRSVDSISSSELSAKFSIAGWPNNPGVCGTNVFTKSFSEVFIYRFMQSRPMILRFSPRIAIVVDFSGSPFLFVLK